MLGPIQNLQLALGQRDEKLRLLNDIRLSDRMIFESIRTFIDRRLDLLLSSDVTRTVPADYDTMILVQPGWRDALEKWRFNGALLFFDSSLATVLQEREGWKIVSKIEPHEPIGEVAGRPFDKTIVLLAPPDRS